MSWTLLPNEFIEEHNNNPICLHKPKISIITLSYNRPKYLSEAIYSVFVQTETDWELIIIDDNSTDLSVYKVMENAQKEQPQKVKLFKTTTNINNLPKLWNFGINVSRGQYICFLDDDNKQYNNFCMKMSNFLDTNQEFQAVSCIGEIIDSNGKYQGQLIDYENKLNKKEILIRNMIDTGMQMFRREVFEKLVGFFDERLLALDDWDIVRRIIFETKKGYGFINERLFQYRSHSNSRIKKNFSNEISAYKIIDTKEYNKKYNLFFIIPPLNRLTDSQRDLIFNIASTIERIPYFKFQQYFSDNIPSTTRDINIYSLLFQMSIEEIENSSKRSNLNIFLLGEDPYAFSANFQRAKFADYIITNDLSTIKYYKQIDKKTILCPVLSVNKNLYDCIKNENQIYDIDVIFVGSVYASRIKFLQKLLSYRPSFQFTIVGSGWNKQNLTNNSNLNIISTNLSLAEVMRLMMRSKIIICYNRQKGDLTIDTIPLSLHRGYLESACGFTLIDNTRPQHSFGKAFNEIFYTDVPHLMSKIDYYLIHEKERKEIATNLNQFALEKFTYEVRLQKVFNAIRSNVNEMIID